MKEKLRYEPIEVCMVGPSFKTQGGISSVLKLYKDNYSEAFKMSFAESYSGFGRRKDLVLFASALIKVFFICLTNKKIIFHIHTASKGSFLRKSIIAAVCRAFGRKHILHIHGAMFDSFLESSTPRRKSKILKVLAGADKTVVLSRQWKDFFLKYLPEEKLAVIYNPSPFMDESYRVRNNSVPSFVFMGRLGERKGAYDLVKAAKCASDEQGTAFTLDMYGDGEVEKFREMVKTEGVEGIVRIKGWIDHSQVGSIYERADAMILPSYAEGLPMSVLEAMGKGLPVISTSVGGIPEAVLDGVNGYIVKPGDVEALCDCIRSVAGGKEARESMGRASLKIARERFSFEGVKEQLGRLYDEIHGGE